jgi:hypothetical protein
MVMDELNEPPSHSQPQSQSQSRPARLAAPVPNPSRVHLIGTVGRVVAQELEQIYHAYDPITVHI